MCRHLKPIYGNTSIEELRIELLVERRIHLTFLFARKIKDAPDENVNLLLVNFVSFVINSN